MSAELQVGTGIAGAEHDQFLRPWGIAYNRFIHRLVVSDGWNYRIQQFKYEASNQSTHIRHLSTIGSFGSGPLQFQFVRGLCYQPCSHHLLVCDSENHRVQILNEEGTQHLGSIGNANRFASVSEGEFNRPMSVACKFDGSICVSDTFNDRVQLFDARGVHIRQFGSRGDSSVQF